MIDGNICEIAAQSDPRLHPVWVGKHSHYTVTVTVTCTIKTLSAVLNVI